MCEPSRPLRAKEREDIFEKKIDQRLAWAESLIDKQYRLYVWNDGKIQVLAAVDGLLITAAGMVFRNGPSTIASAVPLAIPAVPLLLSLWICLRALRSFPHSGRSQEKDDGPNLRSLKGITEHDSWKSYASKFRNSKKEQYLDHTLRQVWGMSINNEACHERMRRGVDLTILGAGLIILGLVAQPFISPAIPAIGKSSKSTQVIASPNPKPLPSLSSTLAPIKKRDVRGNGQIDSKSNSAARSKAHE